MKWRRRTVTAALVLLLGVAAGSWRFLAAAAPETAADQAIFPGQAEPEISAGIIRAYEHALNREYDRAREICLELERRFPDDPSGATGEMVLYQVMMLENDDYSLDAQFRAAAKKAQAAAGRFAEQAPRNDWYYTLLGASNGIEGIYYLRRDEYWAAFYPGFKGLYYMQTAAGMDPENWEARLGIALFTYYRSAYSRLVPIPWLDQRQRAMAEVEMAGRQRPYLSEVSRIALFYMHLNEKDYERARADMDSLIAERPRFVVFYQLAGWALMDQQDFAGAYAYYHKAHELDPSLNFACLKLGECALRLDRKSEAAQWFKQYLAMTANQPASARRKLAESYLKELAIK